MAACCNKSCDMSHIYHKVCTNSLCYLRKLLKIDSSWISTCTCNDKSRSALVSLLVKSLIVDITLVIYAVRNKIKILT